MLTLDAILKATRQMTSYGERGTPGALDHMPAKVQGQPSERVPSYPPKTTENQGKPARTWDDKKKVYK
jgi:hypothetical protein